MIKKIGKDVVSIDIFGAYTQWGKTTLYVNKIVSTPDTDYVVAMPNSRLARREVIARIKKEMTAVGRTNFSIKEYTGFSVDVTKLKDELINNRLSGIQNIYILMGNAKQLQYNPFWTAIHAVHGYFNVLVTSIILDESDEYIVFHSDKSRAAQRDIEFDRVIDGAPQFKEYLFYTATLYTHAFWVFGEEAHREKYDIRWHIQEEGKNYWHFRDIVLNTKDDLSTCFTTENRRFRYTGNFEPIDAILKSQPHHGASIYLHLMRKVEGQDKIRDEILSRYSHLAVITANEEGVWAYRGDEQRAFETLNQAADWCLETHHSIVWIGGQSLERMMTLTNSNASILLSTMVIFSKKSHITGLTQLVGRMTGRFRVENWIRNLYAPADVISQVRECRDVESYFYDAIRLHGTVTEDIFVDMPKHESLVALKARNGATKTTHSKLPVQIYASLEEAITEEGRKNVVPLQDLVDAEEANVRIANHNKHRKQNNILGKISGTNRLGDDEEHHRRLLASDPTNKIHERETLHNTPDGKHIDAFHTQNRLAQAHQDKVKYVTTYDSEGRCLVWDRLSLGTKSTSYHKTI